MIRKILLFLLVVLVILQFFRPKLDNTGAGSAASITATSTVPAEVEQLLKTSCYDCHSNSTNYPWYTKLQPFGWWIDEHVQEGKKELNLDEFGTYSLRRQFHKLEEIIEVVKEGEMPLKSYTLIHTNAKLKEEQKILLTNWATGAMEKMKATYPIDSLIRK
ncbi:heme-binding domain-containing protein [Flavihumibacter sp. CACIAM 22H1]|uniref:heme-binding domain-containing protein n=1 Tax=Flavihumibacter sp. CACIAM 22H1 TaxID=1812911 RepID=UPI0007A82A61|nr:heme-binding domain-containing protein [Flavihumibacter sp. CACIAM 22H1]KYP15285.1 MAG: cytochrome C [Flavihumibacter sp. CACIAM 22H1]